MMRHWKRIRVLDLVRAARLAATGLLTAVAVAAVAGPAQASTTHRALSTTGLDSIRHVILQAAMGGAAIMLVLTIGLLFLGRWSKAAPRPKPRLVPAAGAELDARSTDAISDPRWLAETELGDHSSAAPDLSAPNLPADRDYPDADHQATDAGLAAPSWLGLVEPAAEPAQLAASTTQAGTEADLELVSQVSQPTAADPVSSGDDETSWPDFLALPGDAEQAEAPSRTTGPSRTAEPPGAPELVRHAESAFSPAALRLLGASPMPQWGDDDTPAERHEVALGDDRIEVALRETSAGTGQGTGHAAAPYARWAPLPYDIPEDGLAFACIGAGDEGCLFVDLAAAPGAVAITGNTGAATRLAESIVHQLCTNVAADQAVSVLLVGNSVPRPHPANAISVQTLGDLATASLDSPPDSTDIVFCELHSDADAFTLARRVASARHRIVPVVLGHFPGTAWSLTAFANLPLDDELPALERGGLHYS